jgi:cytochrome oxidase Cu insertion factor (SCO1/SenC/PrrC family)
MTITTVLVVYATLVATLALGISLLILRALPLGTLESARGDALARQDGGPDVGSPAPPFTVRTNTGALLDTADLAGSTYLLTFLSSNCPGCLAAVPGLVGYARQPGNSHRLVTVIVGESQRRAELEQRLASIAIIIGEPEAGPIAAAYRITLFPSYLLISETGTVLANGQSVPDLPQPQRQ